jgi:ParB family chromosome partitioning protein
MSRAKTTAMTASILPIRKIDASDRLRPVDMAKVQLIAEGILAWRAGGNEGIPAPITVRSLGEDCWKLVAGAHRLAACELLGDHEIDAIVRDLDDLQARLMEIDENLCRNELNALDRAAFLTERDRIWREMYPEKDGRKGSAKARWHSVEESETFSFASDAADKVGLSQRSIQMDVKLFRMLSLTPDVIELVRGTWLEDHQGQLKALARVPGADRAEALALMLREDNPAKNVASAIAEMRGLVAAPVSPDEKSFAALVSQWTRASAKARGRFLDHLHSAGALDDYTLGAEG